MFLVERGDKVHLVTKVGDLDEVGPGLEIGGDLSPGWFLSNRMMEGAFPAPRPVSSRGRPSRADLPRARGRDGTGTLTKKE